MLETSELPPWLVVRLDFTPWPATLLLKQSITVLVPMFKPIAISFLTLCHYTSPYIRPHTMATTFSPPRAVPKLKFVDGLDADMVASVQRFIESNLQKTSTVRQWAIGGWGGTCPERTVYTCATVVKTWHGRGADSEDNEWFTVKLHFLDKNECDWIRYWNPWLYLLTLEGLFLRILAPSTSISTEWRRGGGTVFSSSRNLASIRRHAKLGMEAIL